MYTQFHAVGCYPIVGSLYDRGLTNTAIQRSAKTFSTFWWNYPHSSVAGSLTKLDGGPFKITPQRLMHPQL